MKTMNAGITRRQRSGRGAAALGSVLTPPAIVPASVFGRNGTFSPSERITMGFIGVGTQGGGHLSARLLQPDGSHLEGLQFAADQ